MKKMGLLLLLILALLLGFTAALLQRTSKLPGTNVSPLRRETMSDDLLHEEKLPSIPPKADFPHEALPDLHGLSVGTGDVLVEVPRTGVDSERLAEEFSVSNEEQSLVWPKTSGKLKDIEEQVKDIKAQIEEVTLDTVSRTLNALPFVSAEPEEAEWHISGGEVRLEITIPAEDIKIGSKEH